MSQEVTLPHNEEAKQDGAAYKHYYIQKPIKPCGEATIHMLREAAKYLMEIVAIDGVAIEDYSDPGILPREFTLLVKIEAKDINDANEYLEDAQETLDDLIQEAEQ